MEGEIGPRLRTPTRPLPAHHVQPPLRPTLSETGTSKLARDCSAGLVVSSTHVVPDSGSCHTTVPVEPKWPNVAAEHDFPNAPGSRTHPKP